MLEEAAPSGMAKYHETVKLSLENFDDCTSTVSDAEIVFRNNALAKAGYKIATNATPEYQRSEELDEEKKQKRYKRMHACASNIGSVQAFIGNRNLDDLNINNGVLQLDGENVTLEQKVILENNSSACSAHLTQDEIDLNNFINGRTTEVPEAMKRIAQEQGVELPDTMTTEEIAARREEFSAMISEKFPAHNVLNITSTNDLSVPASERNSVLPQLPQWDTTPEEIVTGSRDALSANGDAAAETINLPGVREAFAANTNYQQPEGPKTEQPSLNPQLSMDQFAPRPPQALS